MALEHLAVVERDMQKRYSDLIKRALMRIAEDVRQLVLIINWKINYCKSIFNEYSNLNYFLSQDDSITTDRIRTLNQLDFAANEMAECHHDIQNFVRHCGLVLQSRQ